MRSGLAEVEAEEGLWFPEQGVWIVERTEAGAESQVGYLMCRASEKAEEPCPVEALES